MPHEATTLDPVALLDAMPAIVAVIDGIGVITYIGGLLEDLTGYQPHELLHTNMLDHIDLTWNPLTLESIGFALDHPGIRLPTMMRFITKGGGHRVLETIANNQLDNPKVAGMVVHIRDVDERELTDQILEAFASGEDVETTLRKIHAVGASGTMASDTGVVLLPPRGDLPPDLSCNEAVAELVRSTHPRSPWARAVATGYTWSSTELDELPGPLRDRAAALGYAACWVWPVPHRGRDEVAASLVFWRREPGPPEPSAQTLGDRLVRLATLVLERTEHLRELWDPLESTCRHASLSIL